MEKLSPDQVAALLKQLRDIHLPPAIPDWPWAPARFVILGMLAALLIGFCLWGWIAWCRKRRQKAFLQQIAPWQQTDNFAALAALMKAVAIRTWPKEAVAGLHDEAWLTFLEKTLSPKDTLRFEPRLGRLLLQASYQASSSFLSEVDKQALHQLIQSWLLKNRERTR